MHGPDFPSPTAEHDASTLDWLALWAEQSPGATALIHADSGAELNYSELYRRACRLARWLAERGVRRSDRVAVLATHCIDLFVLYFATNRLGAILVPLNHRLALRELELLLEDCAPRLLVVQTGFEVRGHPQVSFEEVGGAAADSRRSHLPIPFEGKWEDPCMILYTSGTSGMPKGALLSHRMVFWNSISTGLRLDLTSRDVTVSFLPCFHTSGWHVLNTPFLHRGARIVLLDKFDPARVLELCERQRVTVLFGVPTTLAMMAECARFESAQLSSLRFAVVGGESMPIELIQKWQRHGVPIRQGFGLTEFGPNVFSLSVEDSVRKIGSIGTPNYGVEARIVADDGGAARCGQVGELVLRGPQLCSGYWNRPSNTDSLREGWFFTGDLVRQDEDGFWYVAGRKKDMFISGGENVYPAEIERYLSTHPKIAEVAIVGVRDTTWGEVGKAFVAPFPGVELTAEEVLSFCRGNLAKYKVPRHVEIRSSLPRGHSGKVLKRLLA